MILIERRLRLRAAGYLPIPLRGKRPDMKEGWDWTKLNGAGREQFEMWEKVFPDATNTGLLTKLHPAFDVDILHPEVAETIKAMIVDRFDAVPIRVGLAPKFAVLFRTDAPFSKINRPLSAPWEPEGSKQREQKVEFLCDGQQLAAFGIHPDTRQPYRWHGGEPGAVEAKDLPCITQAEAQRLVDDAAAIAVGFGYVEGGWERRAGNGAGREAGEDPQADIELIAKALVVIPNTADWDGWNTMGMATWRATGGNGFTLFDQWSSKSPRYDAANTKKTWAGYFRSPPTSIGAGTIFYLANQHAPGWRDAKWPEPKPEPEPKELAPEPTPPEPQPSPTARITYMKGKTKYNSSVGNVMLALDQEPELMNAFGYDEMQRTEVLLRPLRLDTPGTSTPDRNFVPRPVQDPDITSLQAHMQWKGFRTLGKDSTHEAVTQHARKHAFHPVRNYLNSLQWDGTERLATWLNKYTGTKETEYGKRIGTMFLVGMVARVMRPGCQCDYMIVLEGVQGTFKSSACRILAGEYFSDHLPPLDNKDCCLHLRGKWLVEVAELRAYSRADLDRFKEFLVCPVDRYRPPWGRKDVFEPRQCCFIGTTNKSVYLRDETGNRRIWPVKTGLIKIEELARHRDQLFAEAVVEYRKGAQWWPNVAFERKFIEAEQDARFEHDIWSDPIRDYLTTVESGAKHRNAVPRTTLLEVAKQALNFADKIERLGTSEARRITSILIHLKWERRRHGENGRMTWVPGQTSEELF
jgi:predicted P-loop ATPase